MDHEISLEVDTIAGRHFRKISPHEGRIEMGIFVHISILSS